MSWLVFVLASYGVAAAAVDRYGARRRPGSGFDAIVVAGAPPGPDGRAGGALERRTRLAIELWRRGLAPRLVFTGGAVPGRTTEAAAAAALARELGVPDEAIALEELSDSTEGNARHAARVLGGGRVLVVTDSYHVLRCELVFRRYFEHAQGIGALPPPGPRARMALREIAVLGVYAARGRLVG